MGCIMKRLQSSPIISTVPMLQQNKNGIPIHVCVKSEPPPLPMIQPEALKIANLGVPDLYRRQNGKCFYCLNPMFPAPVQPPKYYNGWTRDHFFPKIFGNVLQGNMVLSCRRCNEEKDNLAPTTAEVKRFKNLYRGLNLATIFGKGAQL